MTLTQKVLALHDGIEEAVILEERIRKAADLAGKSEEKLKSGIIDILSDYFREIVIDKARYERSVRLSCGETRRSDFLFGGLLIEHAGSFVTADSPKHKHAINQLEEQIAGEAS